MRLREQTYFADPFESIEEVREAHGPIMDSSTLSKIASCPREFEIKKVENLRKKGQSAAMAAGSAVHLGFDYYYSIPDPDQADEREAIEVMADKWRSFGIDRATMDPKKAHLSEDHLRGVMAQYFDIWNRQRIEVYEPLIVDSMSDLDLSDVIAARFRFNSDDHLILGESSLVMRFDVGGDDLILAGKPDLPVTAQDGSIYVMDHKTTSSYLSDWWAKSHEVSNKLRGYMAMVENLLGIQTSGGIINGIYVGKHALNPNSTSTRVQRFQFDFTPDHVTEALQNQYAWKKTIEYYLQQDYFPQGCGFGGCACPDICRRDPDTREEVKRTDYELSDHTFWDL